MNTPHPSTRLHDFDAVVARERARIRRYMHRCSKAELGDRYCRKAVQRHEVANDRALAQMDAYVLGLAPLVLAADTAAKAMDRLAYSFADIQRAWPL